MWSIRWRMLCVRERAVSGLSSHASKVFSLGGIGDRQEILLAGKLSSQETDRAARDRKAPRKKGLITNKSYE